ncbi:glycosyltransferase, partial [Microbacteriaceae bacterium K1510]|nr:glycosyltransferase [Microbacteriaceae bacterium K1510]
LYAMPSMHEGFGLPILEAMSAGTPVLTSNVSSMPEVAGGAAVLVDPTSVEDLSAGLQRLMRDDELREALIARGRIQAARFSWANTAQQTLAAFAEAHKRAAAPSLPAAP